jgi:hypothetical protein
VVLFVDRIYAKTLHFLAEPVHLDAARTEPSAIGGTLILRSRTVSGPEKCSLVPKRTFRTIAKYAKPPYNEILNDGSPAMLGPVA